MSHWFWDGILLVFFVLDIFFITYLIKKAWYKLATLAMFLFAFIFYGSFIEPQLIVVTPVEIQLSEQTSKTKTIAFLADPQLGPYKGEAFLKRVVNKTIESQPDLVLLGGDYIYKEASGAPKLSPLLELTQKVPVYAVMGNHDYNLYSAKAPVDTELGLTVQHHLETFGVKVLKNTGEILDDLYLAGVDDYWSRNVLLDEALSKRVAPTVPTLLLAHNPDMLLDLLPEHGVDLMLSGHTHGGQIRLPFLGPIGQIPNQLGQAYDQGLFRETSTQLYISSGLGESGPRARLFNPPEIVLLELSY